MRCGRPRPGSTRSGAVVHDGLGLCALLLGSAIAACSTTLPTRGPSSPPASAPTVASSEANTPDPSSPTEFDVQRVGGTFVDVTALTSTGEALYWASNATIWRIAPGDVGAERVYEDPARGALVWDLAAHGDDVLASERLAQPPGAWRVSLIAGGSPPVEVDSGVAERGAPPTVAIDAERIVWAGFDEASGDPRSFLRVADRSGLEPRTLLDADIDDRLLWYPELDANTLWYATIDPDFEGDGVGDALRIESVNLADPESQPTPFGELQNVFEPAMTANHFAWKQLEAGFSALTWGEIHVQDRGTKEELVVATRGNHPSVGSRFVTYEEFFHRQLLLYDLATNRTFEIPDALPAGKGALGIPTIAGDLLAYSTSVRGQKTVYWTRLPA